MPALKSSLNPRSEAFQANAARMAERLAEVQALQARVVAESASKASASSSAASCCRASAWPGSSTAARISWN